MFIDHIVMTCFDLEATKRFYTKVLKLELAVFGENLLPFVSAIRKSISINKAKNTSRKHTPYRSGQSGFMFHIERTD